MTDHLPECESDAVGKYHVICICSSLRACEQRTFDRLTAEFIDVYAPRLEARGALLGLGLARDAVAALLHSWGRVTDPEAEDMILAAIDALRGGDQ